MTDDLIVTRDDVGTVTVRLSPWVKPAQRLVLLAWVGELLDAETRPIALRMSTGTVTGQTNTLAGRELAGLMDRPILTGPERSRALDLICASRR